MDGGNPGVALTRIEPLLQRYLAIQVEQDRLQQEKAQLRDQLKACLAGEEHRAFAATIGGVPIRVSYSRREEVRYDDDLLRERLGPRYADVARPDLRRLRHHLEEIEPLLTPALAVIGAVDRDRVREAIARGVVRAEEFRGAFRRQMVERLAVSRKRVEDGTGGVPGAGTQGSPGQEDRGAGPGER
ncbi:MAG: hypothetical protein JXR77_12420 [Lentisphaeria bacterium]|nr:hypothetical protein [Lentisphaeria bacterium]